MILLGALPDQLFVNKVSYSLLDLIRHVFTQTKVFYLNNTDRYFFARLGNCHTCQIKNHSQKK